MKKIKQIFHILSYVQYPLMLIVGFFMIKPFLKGFEYISLNPEFVIENYNYALIFLGIMISFSTLQDPTKVSLKIEKKIWKNPMRGKFFLILIAILILVFFTYGLIGFIKEELTNQFSYGSIVLGIGLIAYLRFLIEVFENHREDKNK